MTRLCHVAPCCAMEMAGVMLEGDDQRSPVAHARVLLLHDGRCPVWRPAASRRLALPCLVSPLMSWIPVFLFPLRLFADLCAFLIVSLCYCAFVPPFGGVLRTVHKFCTGPYQSCILVPRTRNNEPCYAFI